MNEVKRLEKIKKRVLTKIPTAQLKYDYEGNLYISDGMKNLTKEFFMPSVNTEFEAWENALIAIKTQQNFNRTHPLRVEMYDIESKIQRIEKRKFKGRVNKEKRRR